MKGKGKPKGSKNRKRAGTKAHAVKKHVNLARREQPTDRGYFYGSEAFDNSLNKIELEESFFEIMIARLAEIRAKLRAGPTSPVALSVTGVLGNPVLYATRAPEWAQLGVIILPWSIALSWRALEHSRSAFARHGEPKQTRITSPGPDTTSPSALPKT
jgi:hypothetical protein